MVKPIIVYPVPMETPKVWAEFNPLVERFCHSMRNTEPGCEYELLPIINYPKVEMPPMMGELEEILHGVHGRTRPVYLGEGCDIGSFLFAAKNFFTENTFMVCMNTRTFAWKSGWLRKLVEAREAFGPGLYATAVSREGGKLHACCRCFAVDSDDFKRYPHKIESRDQGQFFETGDGCLLNWYQDAFGKDIVNAVYWDGTCHIRDTSDAYCLTAPNIYRRGDQSNMLIKDRHTLIFDEASPEEKLRLEKMCFEGV